jgi:hypothetical protein
VGRRTAEAGANPALDYGVLLRLPDVLNLAIAVDDKVDERPDSLGTFEWFGCRISGGKRSEDWEVDICVVFLVSAERTRKDGFKSPSDMR